MYQNQDYEVNGNPYLWPALELDKATAWPHKCLMSLLFIPSQTRVWC